MSSSSSPPPSVVVSAALRRAISNSQHLCPNSCTVAVFELLPLPSRHRNSFFAYRELAFSFSSRMVAGAATASGLSLEEVAAEAKRASDIVGTMGVALFVCTLPGQVTPDRLGSGKMELGLGIWHLWHAFDSGTCYATMFLLRVYNCRCP